MFDMPQLETARLRLRVPVSEDADDLFQIVGDPDVMKYWLGGTDENSEQTRRSIELNQHHWHIHGFGDWVVVEKATNALIGLCGFLPLPEMTEPDLGYAIAKAKWRHGFGLEALQAVLRYGFEILRLPVITACIDPRNTASQKLAESAGFTLSGQCTRREQPRLIYQLLTQFRR